MDFQRPAIRKQRRQAISICIRSIICLLVVFHLTSIVSAQRSSTYEQAVLAVQREIEAGNLDQARSLVNSLSLKYPHDGGLENLLGVIEIQQGHTAEASRSFSLAIAHDPKLVSAYLNLSRIEMESAVTDPSARAKALGHSLKILQLDSKNDDAHYQLATIYLWNKEYRLSLSQLENLSAAARGQIGAEAVSCADHAALDQREATRMAVSTLAANPELTEEDANSCLPGLRADRRAELIDALFSSVQTRGRLSANGLRILGLAQEAEGKLPLSRATLEAAFAADTSSVAPLIDLARVAVASKDYQGALGYIAHARDLDRGNASLPYEFGVICVKMNLIGEARKAINEAVALAPENPEYNFGMGTVASFGHDPTEALPYFEKYHLLLPKDPAGILALGTAHFRAKEYDAALPWFSQAAENKTTSAAAHYYLGRIAREKGQFDQAIAELTKSQQLEPDQPEVLAELGQIHVQMKKFGDAVNELNRALALDPDSYAANFGLLLYYVRTNDSRRAEQSKRFDAIKDKNELQAREMMRVIEIHPPAGSAP